MNSYLITEYEGKILSGFWKDTRPVSLQVTRPGSSLLGNIYVGTVKNVSAPLMAAFVETGTGSPCFLSLSGHKKLLFADGHTGETVKGGDQLIVQVTREAAGVKPPEVSCELSLAGQYAVVMTGTGHIAVSSRISDKQWTGTHKEIVRKWLPPGMGAILRTESYGADETDLERELMLLTEQLSDLIRRAAYRKGGSLLWEAVPAYIRELTGSRGMVPESIVTDIPEVYELCRQHLKVLRPDYEPLCRLYEGTPSLQAVYAVKAGVEEALSRKVYMKSGAYLIIDPTEALTVIDVNSGKSRGLASDTESFYRKVNEEAAKEACRQIRLRNLSGIILIDFVNMKKKEEETALFQLLTELCRLDTVPTTAVDFTRLGLAEITRKKLLPPLKEQFHGEENR